MRKKHYICKVMRVITLDRRGLDSTMHKLEEVCGTDCTPGLVVGIATGGAIVAEGMFAGAPHVSVHCRRPGTARKKRAGMVMQAIRRLPRRLRDAMRIVEANVLRLHRSPRRDVRIGATERQLIACATDILIVDDAVDSGATLDAVFKAIREINPSCRLRSASITVTEKDPLRHPDYSIYDNGTLVRFPWSMDNSADTV